MGRKVVGFRLALLSDELGELVALMQVVRDRPHIVKELAEEIPAALASHHVCAKQQISRGFDSIPKQELLPRLRANITQAFIRSRVRAIGGPGGGGEPALVDAAPVAAEGVKIIRMQL